MRRFFKNNQAMMRYRFNIFFTIIIVSNLKIVGIYFKSIKFKYRINKGFPF